jgi:hypothetical protein
MKFAKDIMKENGIKKLDNPDYKKQTIDVVYENGKVENHECYNGVSGDFYIIVGDERLYLYELPEGESLEQGLK